MCKEKKKIEGVLKQYKDFLIQKRYSQNTQGIYCSYFKDFCFYFKGKDLSIITTEQINSYVLNLIKSKNISISQQNQRINAIKFYYEKVLGREKQYYELYRPKRYLFEGQNGGKYSESSVAKILKKSARKAGIKKVVTPDML